MNYKELKPNHILHKRNNFSKKSFWELDRDKYDHVVFHPEDKVKHEIHVRNPNRNRSYLNQATEHVKNLGSTVDFVKKRNEDKDRKHKKRLICSMVL